MTDRNFESGMGGSQGQGVAGNEYGMGTHDKDAASSSNEEGMGSGQIRNQAATSNQENDFGVGNEARDIAPSSNEEGMGARETDQAVDHSSNEYGMGSGRPAGEEGMGIIPGHHHKSEHKEGGGLKDKIEGIFHKK